MSTPIPRDELDRRMQALELYRDHIPLLSLEAVAEQMHVSKYAVRRWILSLGGHIRTPSEHHGGADSETQLARQLDKRTAKLKDGEAFCHCGLIYLDDGSGQCPTCNGDTEHETELEAEWALFSDAAFLNNPRNIGRFDRAKTDCIRGVIPVW